MAPARQVGGLAYRGMVAWRAALAILGNYALAALLAAAVAVGLPHLGVSRAEATVAGTLLAILALPVIPVFVFAASSAWRATAAMAAGAAALTGLVLWLGAA